MYHEMDRESGKVEQIVTQFHLKILHVVLDSRIACLHQRDPVGGDLSSLSRVRKSDKWFNLVLGDRPAALENLNFWHRNMFDPMIIDIILKQRGSSPAPSMGHHCSLSSPGASPETVIERWVIQYENPRVPAPPQTGDSSASYRKTYKKLIILLRSIYSQMRILPAYRIFRELVSSSQTYNFDLIYKVSSISDPFSRAEEDMMKEYSFVPIEAFPGHLSVSVTYRLTLSNFNLQPLPSLPPKIITDYVGSPTTDPMRSFRSSEKGVSATSFPLRFVGLPSAPPPRPHSWSGGFHARPFSPNQPFTGSPPLTRMSPMPAGFPSPVSDMYGNRIQSYRMPTPQKAAVRDDYQLSPPFSSSASPSTPSYLSGGNPLFAHDRSGTAPVTIPHTLRSRSSRCPSPYSSDPSRHSLPPLSPRSLKHDTSSQESPSGIRSYRKVESVRAGELSAGFTNHYAGQKVGRDSREDSGRFSGLLSSSGSPRVGFSRSSSRLSFQDDFDDSDFSCPFDFDDVDASENQASQNPDRRRASDFASQSAPLGRKSQDAAVGVLVHMLRTAPPLRQDSGCQSSHSLKPECEGVGTASGFFMARRTMDALEELKSYREMKDLLLSKSGTRVLTKE